MGILVKNLGRTTEKKQNKPIIDFYRNLRMGIAPFNYILMGELM